jgi:hypothetical protein
LPRSHYAIRLSGKGGARACVETVPRIARSAESDGLIVTPERWKQVQESLEIAITLAPKERDLFLHQLGDTDLELRQAAQRAVTCGSGAI